MSTAADTQAQTDAATLVERFSLKAFVESCLVLEEGVATHRDIDFGMMAGAGLDPRRGLMPPFMKADSEGLDALLERMENAQEKHGERFTPPARRTSPATPSPTSPSSSRCSR